MYPTIVGRIAEAQKKNRNKEILNKIISEAKARGKVMIKVKRPNIMQTYTEFLFSYPPSLVEIRPPNDPPVAGPKTEAIP